MGKKRTFVVKVNIDDMSALIAALDGPEEKADWIDGYMVGVHGHPPRETWGDAKRSGHGFGASQFEAVEEFRAAQTVKSAMGVDARESSKSNPRVTKPYTQAGTLYPSIHQSINPETQETKEPRERVAGSAEIVVQAWNSSVEGTNLPRARETPPRRRTIATRLKEKGWIEDFRIAAAFVASSPFHRGDNDRKWTATIDYLLQAGKATELAEKARTAPVQQTAPATSNLPEWKREKIAQLEREARRFESGGMGQSAKMIRREIADLMGGDNA